jgi:hypothetical protein
LLLKAVKKVNLLLVNQLWSWCWAIGLMFMMVGKFFAGMLGAILLSCCVADRKSLSVGAEGLLSPRSQISSQNSKTALLLVMGVDPTLLAASLEYISFLSALECTRKRRFKSSLIYAEFR